jgi:hypothetical protein
MEDEGTQGLPAIDIDMRKRTLWIEGIEISFEALHAFVRPSLGRYLYRLDRKDGVVIVHRLTEEQVIWIDDEAKAHVWPATCADDNTPREQLRQRIQELTKDFELERENYHLERAAAHATEARMKQEHDSFVHRAQDALVQMTADRDLWIARSGGRFAIEAGEPAADTDLPEVAS